MTYDFETAKYWRAIATRLRAEAIRCRSEEVLAKLQAARLADDHAASFEAALAKSTASVASQTGTTGSEELRP